MADSRIKRNDLWPKLKNIKKREVWIKAAERLGLNVTQPKGGSSHYAIRLPKYNNHDIKGLISNVYNPVRKDISESIFKKLLDANYEEDEIWIALKFLKK
ncbi:MAG: hypothetical protein PHI91_01415 [Candidatus Pacebacteria bacterium]|nr:hypothetical protein [Candidatus Paceibacterota bacterium]MDD2757065.1 hypothetical protein [Candidatus Paceibacterota bacterium]MDD3283685.1 hypothetical protein [Candidatus Paceibacterota bacterium]MDD3969840.1 hypothetical protein [Candidatus Paceibacterota bacterium]MDD4737748.1 hypothetical protein [Candidatus Paceibacterota bacterium]